MIYDAPCSLAGAGFAHLPIYGLEDLGFVPRGEAGALTLSATPAGGHVRPPHDHDVDQGAVEIHQHQSQDGIGYVNFMKLGVASEYWCGSCRWQLPRRRIGPTHRYTSRRAADR